MRLKELEWWVLPEWSKKFYDTCNSFYTILAVERETDKWMTDERKNWSSTITQHTASDDKFDNSTIMLPINDDTLLSNIHINTADKHHRLINSFQKFQYLHHDLDHRQNLIVRCQSHIQPLKTIQFHQNSSATSSIILLTDKQTGAKTKPPWLRQESSSSSIKNLKWTKSDDTNHLDCLVVRRTTHVLSVVWEIHAANSRGVCLELGRLSLPAINRPTDDTTCTPITIRMVSW